MDIKYFLSVKEKDCFSVSFDVGTFFSDRILFDIHKWCSSFHYGKCTGNDFVPDNINDCHFGFSVLLPSDIIFPQFTIVIYSAYGSQMQSFLYLFISDGTDLCSSPHTGSGLAVKWRNTAVAGEFSPIVKPGEIVSIDDKANGNDKSDAFNSFKQFKISS